jgi:hypothetical protein
MPAGQAAFWMRGVGEDVLKRALGCMILVCLPQRGLDEALWWLKDAWHFYSSLPESEPSTRALQQPATVKSVYERPALDFIE